MTVQPALPPPTGTPPPVADAPPRTQLLTTLTAQTALLTQLFQSLSAPISTTSTSASGLTLTSSNPAGAPLSGPAAFGNASVSPSAAIPHLYAALQHTTATLQSQTEALWTHQRAWLALKRQEAEVRDLEGRVRGLVWELENGRAELEGLVQDGKGVRGTIERLEKAPIPVRTLLSHAHNLANYTSAPPVPADGPSAPHLRKYSTPWPAETAMREGLLYMEGGTMAPVGDAVPREYGEVVHEQANAGAGAGAGTGVHVQGHGEVASGGEMEHDDWVEAAPTRAGGEGQVFDLDLNSDSDDD